MGFRICVAFVATLFATAAIAEEPTIAAREALQASDTARAIQLATEALNLPKVAPSDARLLHAIRGQAYLVQKEYRSAADDLTAAIGTGGSSVDVCGAVGDVFLLHGKSEIGLFKYRDSLADMKAATECEPKSPEAWTGLGNSYFGLLDGPNAIDAYNHALQLAPNYKEALSQRAKNFENAQKIDDALADYTAVLKLDPNDADTYNNRGTLFMMAGRLDESVSDFTKAAELDPTDFLVFANRAYSYFYQKKYDLAQADLNQAKKLHDDPLLAAKRSATWNEMFTKQIEYQMASLQFQLDNLPK